MKRCAYCGRESENQASHCRECGTLFIDPSADANPQAPGAGGIKSVTITFSDLVPDCRRLLCLLGLMILAGAAALLLSRDSRKMNAPGIVVLATWFSNGEQFVTFRPEPTNAEVTYVDVISAAGEPKAQPLTYRSFGYVFPVRNKKETNCSLHLVAHPKPGVAGLAYTPGSYTVAYTPTENAHRVRAGVAFEHRGIADYARRLYWCWERKTLALMRRKSCQDPTFVTTEPISNAVAEHGRPYPRPRVLN